MPSFSRRSLIPQVPNTYNKYLQEAQVKFDPPDLKPLVPHSVTLVRQKNAGYTASRLALVAFAAFAITFLTVACFQRAKAQLLGSANRRNLAGFPSGEGPSTNENEADEKGCQQGPTEHKRGETSHPSQDASNTGKRNGPRSEPPTGSLSTSSFSRIRQNSEHTEEAISSLATRLAQRVLRSVLECVQGTPYCGLRSELQEDEGTTSRSPATAGDGGREEIEIAVEEDKVFSADQSAGSDETPKKRKHKTKLTSGIRSSATVFDKLQALGNILTFQVSNASQLLEKGYSLQLDFIWLLIILERATSDLVTDAKKACGRASGQLTPEQLAAYFHGIEAVESTIGTARDMISHRRVSVGGSGSGEQASDSFIRVVVNTTLATNKLKTALERYKRQPSQANLALLLDAYEDGRKPFAEAEALKSCLMDEPMYKAALKLLSGLVEKLARLSSIACDAVIDPTEGPEGGASGPASPEHVHSKQKQAMDKATAKSLRKELKKLKDHIRTATRRLWKASSSTAELKLSGLLAEAQQIAGETATLITTGTLNDKNKRKLESALAKMVEALNEFLAKSG